MHILIVEDEPKIRDVLKAYLEKEGWRVDCTSDGHDAVRKFDYEQHDMILLDLKLEGLSGEEVCQKIRERSDVPIIMITSKKRENDTVRGLNLGADDYIVKPFRVKEVIARVQALQRRIQNVKDPDQEQQHFIFRKGELVVNLDTRTVLVNSKHANLTATEFKLLSILINDTKKIFSRSELSYVVQGYRFQGDSRTIDAHVKNLRKKIEKDKNDPKYILTHIGKGYQFGVSADES